MFSLSKKFKNISIALMAAGLIIFILLLSEIPGGKNAAYFFDIGQGDAILLVSKENHQVLIDGSKDSLVLEELSSVMPFWDRSLDLIILSHPHADHVGGLVSVLEHFDVGLVVLTGVQYDSVIYEEFLHHLEKVPIIWAEEKSDLRLGNLELDFIFPQQQLLLQEFENLNNSSIVLRADFGDKRILFTGDIEKEVEAYIIKHIDHSLLEADILKIAHHGSNSSSTSGFLRAVAAEIAIIQAGKGNRFGHPHKEVLERLKSAKVQEILRTDVNGTIALEW